MIHSRRRTIARAATAVLAGAAACVHAHNAPPRWFAFPEPAPMPTADTTMLVPAAGGARLYVAVFHRHGTSPIVLLHPGILNSDVWANEITRLAPSHEVIVIDTRGHGRSTLGATPLSYTALANDVVTILDSLHLARVSVIGWSDGGITALRLAIDHPARLAGMLAFGANFDTSGNVTTPPDSATKAINEQYLARAAAEYHRLSPTPGEFARLLAAIGPLESRGPDIRAEELRSIRVPATIVAADHDQFVTAAHSARLASLIPGARLRVLGNVSHEAPLQDPTGFDSVVREFLNTVRF